MKKRALPELKALATKELLRGPVIGVGEADGDRLVFILAQSSARSADEIRRWATDHHASYEIQVAGSIRSL